MSEGSIQLTRGSSARGMRKSKLGCSTCKVRHVKCDESKPSCRRCLAAGRICDGYSSTVSPDRDIQSGPARSKKERRYFDLFRDKTIHGLMGFDQGSTFWSYMVLQFSQSSPAVLHAALALGALHEYLYGPPNTIRDTGSYRLCLIQYNKSIGYLRSKQSTQPVQLTLTCCILFFCLENAQGNYDTALAHLQNGLKILQGWKANANMSASEDVMIDNLTQIFRRLDMQATVFHDSRPPESNPISVAQSPDRDHSTFKRFSSMRDAQISLEETELRLFYVLTTKSLQYDSFQSHEEMISARAPLLCGLASRFREWKEAFDSFSIQESDNLHTKDLQMGVLLALHHETTSLMLDIKVKPNPNMGDFSNRELKIMRINKLSRSLINSCSSGSKFAFSADTGVIAPLYYAAMNATSSPVRQQAIEILHSVKWKEGFWDAETAAKIAENVSRVKMAGTHGLPVTGSIPVLAKAHSVVTCF